MMMPLAIIDPGTGEHRLDMMGSLKRAFEDATLKMELRFKEEQVCLLNISVYVQSMFSLWSVYVQSIVQCEVFRYTDLRMHPLMHPTRSTCR